MNYRQALEYIDSFLVFGSKPGLKRIRNLMKLLGNVQNKLKYIHVAGTNGKGSVCAYLSSILTDAGALPHLWRDDYGRGFCRMLLPRKGKT